jgi:CRP/FNR family transcriptional regulator
LTTGCLIGASDYPASGIAEADTRLLVLPKDGFDRLMAHHAAFRQYVFSLFAERLADLMALIEAVTFQKLDRRIAGDLLGRGRVLHLTHQQLADEVGSVREIVSRILKTFANEGHVRLGRGSIEILDAAALRRVAAGDDPR